MASREFLPEERPAFDLDRVSGVMEKLIDSCRDAENGYRDAAEHITDSTLKAWFQQQSLQRAQFALDLDLELKHLGKWEQTHQGTISGNVSRTWLDLRLALGGGDRTILEAVEAGEDRSRTAYQEALQQPLPPEALGIIRSQAQAVFAAHDRARELRDQRKAA